MYSTSSRTKRIAAPGSRSAIKNCRLCFSKGGEDNELGNNPKLPDLYCKYLHSSLTHELSIGSDDQQLCTRCIVSGKELITLSEQMEIIQKSLSELVFMFSLEILHRRGKTTESQETTGKKLIEFDVYALPNCESWNNPAADTSGSPSETIIPENMFTQNAEDQIIVPEFVDHHSFNDVSIGEIKLEIFDNSGNEDSCNYKEEGTNPNMPYLTDTEFQNNAEMLIKTENVVMDNSESSTCSENLLNPIIQFQKLDTHSQGSQIIAEEDTDYFVFDKTQSSEDGKTVRSKRNSRSSFKLTQQNSEPLNEDGSRSATPVLRGAAYSRSIYSPCSSSRKKISSGASPKGFKPPSRRPGGFPSLEPQPCKGCGNIYADARIRSRCHERDRALKGAFTCRECGTKFMRSWLLRRHLREIHQGAPRKS